MKTTLVIGDSYSAAREGDTGLDRGWPALVPIAPENRQAISGSTAAQWAADFEGRLTRAANTTADALVLSLLGNDAFLIEEGKQSPMYALQALEDFTLVVAKLKRPTTLVLLYPDPFAGKNQAFNIGLPLLNGAILNCVRHCCPEARLMDLGGVLGPDDFNGTDIHPVSAAHGKIAEAVRSALC